MSIKSCVTISLVRRREAARSSSGMTWRPPAARRPLGFDAVEVFPPSAESIDPARSARLLDDVGLKPRGRRHRRGLGHPPPHPYLPDSGRRAKAREFVRSIIDVGGPFGAPAIIGSMQGR